MRDVGHLHDLFGLLGEEFREGILAGLAGEGFRGLDLRVEFRCAIGGLGPR